MVGTRLSLGSGVRLLVVELGWPRTPRDGFIRGGGLACGNIKHVGIKPANEELRLVLNPEGTPSWIVLGREGAQDLSRETREVHEMDVRAHLAILLDQLRNTPTRP
jgi:hypothetical protein